MIRDMTPQKELLLSEVALERSLLESGIGSHAVIESTNNNNKIPVIDMSLPDHQVAEEMWMAAKNVGFFIIKNHGIAEQDIDNVFEISRQFFGLSQEEKETQSPWSREFNSGYEHMAQAPPSTGTADQKETFNITASKGCMNGRWPKDPPNLRTTTENMIQVAHGLACRIVTLLETKACPHLKPGTLANAHHLWGDDGQCVLRLLHYPPVQVEELTTTTKKKPENLYWRAGPHTDWGNVTLLFQRPGEDGLECRANPRAQQQQQQQNVSWVAVPPIPGGITVNIGDMLMRWSDGNLFSNLHRVRMPKTTEECQTSRYSVAFFLQADKSAIIQSQTNQTISAGDFFSARIGSHYES